jgi:hypothetical protein
VLGEPAPVGVSLLLAGFGDGAVGIGAGSSLPSRLSFSISGLKKVTTRPSLSSAACGRNLVPGGASTNVIIRGLALMVRASGSRAPWPTMQIRAGWFTR